MKKLLLAFLCCLIVCGCGNKEEIEALKGTWVRDKLEYIGINQEYFTFEDNNKFTYKKMLYNWDEANDTMKSGYHIYSGTYKIKNNIIYLNIDDKDTTFKVNECDLCDTTPPSEKFIIDFNLMKICERDLGLNCKYYFTKDTE